MATEQQDDYILGVDPGELQRLRSQHQVWVEQLYALAQRTGLKDGDVVLDLGCGPGTTTFELAQLVGPSGKVIACDASEKYIEVLAQEAVRLQLACVEPRVRRVEALDLAPASLDAAYGRWILSWLPDIGCVVGQVAEALRPGGVYLLQEYLDWAAMKLLPRSAIFDAAVEACMESWRVGGGTINAAAEIPELASSLGLEVEHFQINARSGRVGSLIWKWLGEFYAVYLARLTRQGAFSAADYDRFLAEWKQRTEEDASILIAPVMADIVLRKPRTLG